MGIPAKVSLLFRVKFEHWGSEVLQIVEIGTIIRNLQVVVLTSSRCKIRSTRERFNETSSAREAPATRSRVVLVFYGFEPASRNFQKVRSVERSTASEFVVLGFCLSSDWPLDPAGPKRWAEKTADFLALFANF